LLLLLLLVGAASAIFQKVLRRIRLEPKDCFDYQKAFERIGDVLVNAVALVVAIGLLSIYASMRD